MDSGGFQGIPKQSRKGEKKQLTCPIGLVALGGQAGHTAAHIVDGDHAELVIDVRGEAEHSRVDTPGVPGVVVPNSWLQAVLLKLDNVVWGRARRVGMVL